MAHLVKDVLLDYRCCATKKPAAKGPHCSLNRVISSHPIPSHPIPSHPIPSHPIPSHPTLCHFTSSHLISSHRLITLPIITIRHIRLARPILSILISFPFFFFFCSCLVLFRLVSPFFWSGLLRLQRTTYQATICEEM